MKNARTILNDTAELVQRPVARIRNQIERHGRASPAVAVGTTALGHVLLGAIALGAVAMGAVAVGRLAIGRARIRHLRIDELDVRHLRIERQEGPGALPAE